MKIIQNYNDYIFSYSGFHTLLRKMPKIKEMLGYNGPDEYMRFRRCDCGTDLALAYSYIIYRLDEAKLLPKDYKPMCGFCHILACIGFYVPD